MRLAQSNAASFHDGGGKPEVGTLCTTGSAANGLIAMLHLV